MKNLRRNSVWIIILLASAFLIFVSSINPVSAQTVNLTPNTGTGGTLVQISASGYDSGTVNYIVTFNPNTLITGCSGSACTTYTTTAGATITAPTATTTVTSFTTSILSGYSGICNNIGGGSCSGSFVVSPTAPAGIYVVGVYGGAGCASSCSPSTFGQFVVGAPSAQISLSPTVGAAGTTVVISGSGFSIADTGCSISTGNSIINLELFGSTAPYCSMSAGSAGGSFTVNAGSPAAPAGLYVITVSGCVGGPPCPFPYAATDFASAYFEVPSTTITTTTSSIQVLTSSTATFTTTTGISSTLTTTSISSTGITTEQSSAFTLVTYLAALTSTSISTVFTTSTASLASTTRTTTTLFTTSVIGGTGMIAPLLYSPPSEMVNILGIISVIGLIGPILLRRFLT